MQIQEYILSLIVLSSASLPVSAMDEPNQIHIPVQRATVTLSGQPGETTVAVSAMTFAYDIPDGARGLPGDVVRNYCAALTAEDRKKVAECVLLDEHTLRLAGRVEERDSLFLEGAWRDDSREWPRELNDDPQAIVEHYAEYGDILFGSASRWADRIYIGYASTAKADPARLLMQSGSAFWQEPGTGDIYLLSSGGWASRPRVVDLIERAAYSLTRRGSLQEFDQSAMEIKEFPLASITEVPDDLRAWRILPAVSPRASRQSVDRAFADGEFAAVDAAVTSSLDQSRILLERIIDPSAPGAIGENDLVLYLRESPLVVGPAADRTPILQLDGALLDDAGRALQRQLATALVVSDGGAALDQRYFDTIHPDAHPRIRIIEQRRRIEEQQKASGGITPPATPLRFPAAAIPSLRVVSRVITGECVVWFGWLPDSHTVRLRSMGNTDRPAIAQDQPGQFVTIVHRKSEDGRRLTYTENPGILGPERLATQILTSPGVAESLLRSQRQITAPPAPGE